MWLDVKVSEGFADQSAENYPSRYIKGLMEFFKNELLIGQNQAAKYLVMKRKFTKKMLVNRRVHLQSGTKSVDFGQMSQLYGIKKRVKRES